MWCRAFSCRIVLALTCFLLAADTWAEDDDQTVAVKQWIASLDGDLYDTRQQAQQQLEKLGLPALELVAQESRTGTLESSTRAINILLAWSESEDRKLRIAALEKLITLHDRPRESSVAHELLADAREEEALEAIVALGANHTIPPRTQELRFNNQMLPPQVVIGAEWKGGTEGLKHLAAIRRATTVSFHSAPVDDSIIDILIGLKSVRRFEFYGTSGVSKQATDRLKKIHGNVEVRSAARLGVKGDFGTAKIVYVDPGSAADKAGIQVNDQVVEFNGEKVQDFTVLTRRIAGHQPGDTVELTIIRNRELQKIKVTFDRWGEFTNQTSEQNENRKVDAPQPSPPKPIRLDRR